MSPWWRLPRQLGVSCRARLPAAVWVLLLTTGAGMVMLSLPAGTAIRSELSTEKLACRADMAVNVLPPMPEDDSQLVLQLFRYLTNPHQNACRKVARQGGGLTPGLRAKAVLDGHKFVCLDAEQVDLPRTDDCLVYSIGINNDWSFDYDMEAFGCRVFAFDPTTNASSGSRGGSIFFSRVGVGERDGVNERGWPLLTLDSLLARLGHAERTIHFLKMDVDDAEWGVLRQQVERGEQSTLARNVQQLGVELHFLTHLPPERHSQFYRDFYRTVLGLQALGFYLFSFEENLVLLDWVQIPGLGRNLTTAMEVVWVKSECARQAAARRPLT